MLCKGKKSASNTEIFFSFGQTFIKFISETFVTPWMCGVALHTRYSREFDIAVFDKSDAFSRLLQWLAAGTKARSRYKRKFELSEFDITRFDCIDIGLHTTTVFPVFITS